MDNTQLTAPDGSWFLFADWQGMTRLAMPGDSVKTDASLDRPGQSAPLVLRPDGRVWSAPDVDIEPVSLTAIAPAGPCRHSPDPLGGPEIEFIDGEPELSIRGRPLRLTARGAAVQLGGAPGRSQQVEGTRYNIYHDHAIVAFGLAQGQAQVALVLRTSSGAGRVRWCMPVLRAPNSSPDAFRERGPSDSTGSTGSTGSSSSTWLADRDLARQIAYLAEVRDDGTIVSEAHTPAVAGPWVFDGQVWWQPDDAILCAGPRLGAPAQSFMLRPEHAGPGRLLRLPGRQLFVPWHGGVILDLAPTRPGAGELPREHTAADAPMYHEAERLLRPISMGMARRGVRVGWIGCSRGHERIEPRLKILGRRDLITYMLGRALRAGLPAPLARLGVTGIDVDGGGWVDDVLSQPGPTTAQDLHDLIMMLDAAGISRAAGIVHLYSLAEAAQERGVPLGLTPEVEALALAAVLSGLRREHSGGIPPATVEALAEAAPRLHDRGRLAATGIDDSEAAPFLTVFGHRVLGAAAAGPVHEALLDMDPARAQDVARMLGQPDVP